MRARCVCCSAKQGCSYIQTFMHWRRRWRLPGISDETFAALEERLPSWEAEQVASTLQKTQSSKKRARYDDDEFSPSTPDIQADSQAQLTPDQSQCDAASVGARIENTLKMQQQEIQRLQQEVRAERSIGRGYYEQLVQVGLSLQESRDNSKGLSSTKLLAACNIDGIWFTAESQRAVDLQAELEQWRAGASRFRQLTPATSNASGSTPTRHESPSLLPSPSEEPPSPTATWAAIFERLASTVILVSPVEQATPSKSVTSVSHLQLRLSFSEPSVAYFSRKHIQKRSKIPFSL